MNTEKVYYTIEADEWTYLPTGGRGYRPVYAYQGSSRWYWSRSFGSADQFTKFSEAKAKFRYLKKHWSDGYDHFRLVEHKITEMHRVIEPMDAVDSLASLAHGGGP